ncbi:hypothetical protein [Agrobacterium vitis]|uniref:hypothetical protein n=1 Tax=Agrobacterium vitis TaxID=373 RepID=UPI0008DBFE64|nr:hypothetical protein [Agrobacterium vitis]
MPAGTPRDPGLAHREDLRKLAEIGYIRGLENKLQELAKTPDMLPFTEELRPFVQAFDMAGLIACLDRYQEGAA